MSTNVSYERRLPGFGEHQTACSATNGWVVSIPLFSERACEDGIYTIKYSYLRRCSKRVEGFS